MPIYAYRCTNCGHEKDVLQKMSDAVLTVCPECKAEAFVKQVTAAGFQLKGSGWYVTDFKSGNKPAESKSGSKPETTSADTSSSAAPSTSAPTTTATPAATSTKTESPST